MDYKLLALDLDDTLLNDEYAISPRNFKALQKAAARGINVTLATGRTYQSALPYALQLDIKTPLITCHGALIKRASGDQAPLRQVCVPRDMALEIIRFGEANGFHINLSLNDKLYVKEENENTGFYRTITSVPLEMVGNLADYLEQTSGEPTKLTIINRHGRLPELQKELVGKYGSELSIFKSRTEFLEITHKMATKGQALKYLAELDNLSSAQVIAIGDNYNDYDMIQYAGIGVAMGNAPLDVQKAANIVTGTYAEDGVALFLENYIL